MGCPDRVDARACFVLIGRHGPAPPRLFGVRLVVTDSNILTGLEPDARKVSLALRESALATERTATTGLSFRETEPAADQIDGLFRSQAPQLLRFLSRRTGGHEDAADMLQEAFLRLIRLVSLEAFPVSPEAYLHQIAGNLLRDRSRRRKTRSEELHEPIDEDSLVDPAPGPADLLKARELLAAYEAALLKLKPKTRWIFLLHRREGRTYAQIATEAGLSVSGVEKQMMKAIAHIDRALGRP